ncbi:hypothetical protein AB0M57_15765 [Streptomyces sp. NPDC051597]|uniref:hypothetical protein n=1 Tax=Streptomyces sp. NPDC051597 TaxID=3155049 RepID=UPI0034202D4B
MAESDGISRSGDAGREAEGRPRSYEASEGRSRSYEPSEGAVGLPVAAQDLPGLLASLGVQLERHTAEELVVLLRAEVEEREVRAYAAGWRDAAAQYQRALDETASAARARSLRRAGRRQGQGEVIPLRREPPPRPGPAAPPEPDPAQPGLVRKSPRSKAPTIPPLGPPRRERGGGGARPPEEGPG